MLDRLADWLDDHEHPMTLGAWVFLLCVVAYIAGHVAVTL